MPDSSAGSSSGDSVNITLRKRGKDYASDSSLGLGKPNDSPEESDLSSGEKERRDFTIKPTIHRNAPPPPSHGPLPWPTSPPPSSPTKSSQHDDSLSRSNTTPTRRTTTSSSSFSTTPLSPQSLRHKHTNSMSSIHAPIPQPEYTVRSQPVGLEGGRKGRHRSGSSISSMESVLEPTISGGLLVRSLSTSSTSSNNSLVDHAQEGLTRPLKHRSESLPIFPPLAPSSVVKDEDPSKAKGEGGGINISDLPANPKMWLPTHLSIYLSRALQLHPLMQDDITNFVRESKISGKQFLRLKEEDMTEMGINVRWRPLLLDAKEVLRRGALGGRTLWGFGGTSGGEEGVGENQSESEVDSEAGNHGDEDWQKSWRKTKGVKTSGRVRGMAQAFESPARPSTPPSIPYRPPSRSSVFDFASPNRHGRNDSVNSFSSEASIDYGPSSDDDAPVIPSPFDFDESPDTSPALGGDSPVIGFSDGKGKGKEVESTGYQENIVAHENPYGLVRRSSIGVKGTMVRSSHGLGSRMSVRELVKWDVGPGEEEEEDKVEDATIKSPSRGSGSGKGAKLEELFGLRSSTSTSKTVIGEEDESDLVGLDVGLFAGARDGDRRGSMVWVKKSQLEDLQRRLEEVETKLGEVLSPSRPLSPSSPPPTNLSLGEWVLHSFSAISGTSSDGAPTSAVQGPLSWTALGGYCVAASIGIGIVAGEVVVSKLFGLQLHRR